MPSQTPYRYSPIIINSQLASIGSGLKVPHEMQDRLRRCTLAVAYGAEFLHRMDMKCLSALAGPDVVVDVSVVDKAPDVLVMRRLGHAKRTMSSDQAKTWGFMPRDPEDVPYLNAFWTGLSELLKDEPAENETPVTGGSRFVQLVAS